MRISGVAETISNSALSSRSFFTAKVTVPPVVDIVVGSHPDSVSVTITGSAAALEPSSSSEQTGNRRAAGKTATRILVLRIDGKVNLTIGDGEVEVPIVAI